MAVGSSFSMPDSNGAMPISVGPPLPPEAPGADATLIQQTKHEIRQLIQEITLLAQSDVDEDQFIEGFLTRVVSALAAAGGAVWGIGDDGQLDLQYQVNYPARILVDDDSAAQTRHSLLLRNIAQNGHPTLVPPQSGAVAEDEAGNPTDYLLILATLKVEQRAVGVIEIFQRSGGGPTTQRGYLRFLVQMADLANDYLKSRRLRHLGDRQLLWESLERFLRIIHRGLDLQSTAYTIVNESRPLVQCDRISLALRHGRKYRVVAVSGLDSIDRRAVEIKLLNRLASAVSGAGQPLWYVGASEDIPPQIDEPLHAYLDHAHAKMIAVLPLRLPAEDTAPKLAATPTLGVLIVEKLSDNRLSQGLRERVEVVATHSATALANAVEYQSLFLLPLWKALGKAKWIVQARTLPKTLSAIAVVAAGAAALCLVPTDFDLPARGKLQPAIRRDVFAQIEGVVTEVAVRHEKMVEAHETLCKLSNNDLDVEYSNLRGRKKATHERIMSVLRSVLERRLTTEDQNRMDGELLELRQVEQSIDSEMVLLDQKCEQLTVTSDMAGQVVTWNVQDSLIHRPVEKGQVLMTIVDPHGPWELELYMPERRMGHLNRSLHESATELTVTFMLASHAGREFRGSVVEVHRTAEIHGDEGNSVTLRVAVDQATLPERRIDTTVTARVHCGTRSVGYVWFHEVLETVQAKILFWL